jgi:peptide deformylase
MRLTRQVLYKTATPIDVTQLAFINDLSTALRETMLKNNGIGLAAPQCGIPKRIFVMYTNGQHRTVVNPEILTVSNNLCTIVEGCLSFPNKFVDVSRPDSIVVKYYNQLGSLVEETLNGIDARCFLHEHDHLDGITMYKRKKLT